MAPGRRPCVPDLAVKAGLQSSPRTGITNGMKVAVSIPDDVFSQGEAIARRLSLSRSKLYARALEEFAKRHDPAALTAAYDAALEAAGDQDSSFAMEAARRVFANTEW